MQDVRSIINEALQQQGVNPTTYASYVGPVVQRLEGEVASVVEKAKTVMAEQGLSEQDQTDILVTVGLIPEPQQEATNAESNSGEVAALREEVSAMKATLDKAVAFAQRHGLRL